jgi:hypothetical protein
MFDLSVNVTGPQIARAMFGDEEETARFFDEIAEMTKREDDIKSLAQHIADHCDAERLTAWMLSLVSAVEEAMA